MSDFYVQKGQMVMIHLKSGMLAINTNSTKTDYERKLIGNNSEVSRLSKENWCFCFKVEITRHIHTRDYEFKHDFGYNIVPQDIFSLNIDFRKKRINEQTRIFSKEYRFVGMILKRNII